MQQVSALHSALSIYFAAKTRMFAHVPAFRLLRMGPLTCFHNHPGWPEVDAFYAVDGEVGPREVVAAIRAYQPHPRHMVTVFTASPASILPSYEATGYRSLPGTQPFLSKTLAALPSDKGIQPVRRVESAADVKLINSDREVMDPAHLNDGLYRYYYVQQDGKPVCWGRCVVISPDAIYVAGMDTPPGVSSSRPGNGSDEPNAR